MSVAPAVAGRGGRSRRRPPHPWAAPRATTASATRT